MGSSRYRFSELAIDPALRAEHAVDSDMREESGENHNSDRRTEAVEDIPTAEAGISQQSHGGQDEEHTFLEEERETAMDALRQLHVADYSRRQEVVRRALHQGTQAEAAAHDIATPSDLEPRLVLSAPKSPRPPPRALPAPPASPRGSETMELAEIEEDKPEWNEGAEEVRDEENELKEKYNRTVRASTPTRPSPTRTGPLPVQWTQSELCHLANYWFYCVERHQGEKMYSFCAAGLKPDVFSMIRAYDEIGMVPGHRFLRFTWQEVYGIRFALPHNAEVPSALVPYVGTYDIPPFNEDDENTYHDWLILTMQNFRASAGPCDFLRFRDLEGLYGEREHTWVARRLAEGTISDDDGYSTTTTEPLTPKQATATVDEVMEEEEEEDEETVEMMAALDGQLQS